MRLRRSLWGTLLGGNTLLALRSARPYYFSSASTTVHNSHVTPSEQGHIGWRLLVAAMADTLESQMFQRRQQGPETCFLLSQASHPPIRLWCTAVILEGPHRFSKTGSWSHRMGPSSLNLRLYRFSSLYQRPEFAAVTKWAQEARTTYYQRGAF